MVSKSVANKARIFLFFASLVFSFGTASCEEGSRLPSRELTILRADGSSVKLLVEVADDAAERERGLMYRKTLPEGEGMLFVFQADQPISFWMKNTRVPLSIAFISSDGRIIDLHDMTPLSLAPVNSERSSRYALEVPQGWFSRAGIRPGDRLILSGD